MNYLGSWRGRGGAGAGAGAEAEAGAERRKGDISKKKFDFGARVKFSDRVEATAAGKLPHVHRV